MTAPKNPKRIKRLERKIPNLITDDLWGGEFDRNDWRFEKFKQEAPERYIPHRERLLDDLDLLKFDMYDWWEKNKRLRRK